MGRALRILQDELWVVVPAAALAVVVLGAAWIMTAADRASRRTGITIAPEQRAPAARAAGEILIEARSAASLKVNGEGVASLPDLRARLEGGDSANARCRVAVYESLDARTLSRILQICGDTGHERLVLEVIVDRPNAAGP